VERIGVNERVHTTSLAIEVKPVTNSTASRSLGSSVGALARAERERDAADPEVEASGQGEAGAEAQALHQHQRREHDPRHAPTTLARYRKLKPLSLPASLCSRWAATSGKVVPISTHHGSTASVITAADASR
jgi:hypothetical protein